MLLQSAEEVLLGLGDNRYGQCGADITDKNYLESPTPARWAKEGPFFAKKFAAGYQFAIILDSR